jgi:hypothetical protein
VIALGDMNVSPVVDLEGVYQLLKVNFRINPKNRNYIGRREMEKFKY